DDDLFEVDQRGEVRGERAERVRPVAVERAGLAPAGEVLLRSGGHGQARVVAEDVAGVLAGLPPLVHEREHPRRAEEVVQRRADVPPGTRGRSTESGLIEVRN